MLTFPTARISDEARVVRLLEGEGGSVGRREIIVALGLSDDRYSEIAQRLVNKKTVTSNRGRAGGLQLGEAEVRQPKPIPEPVERVNPPLEKDLYPAFVKYLIPLCDKRR